MECKLLRTVDFKLDLDAHIPTFSYVRSFIIHLYEKMLGKPCAEQLTRLAEAICNDSFFTYVNLLYTVQTVALAAVLLAAAKYKYPTPLSDSEQIRFNFEGCFMLRKTRYMRREKRVTLTKEEEEQMRSHFDQLHWVKKIDDRIELPELLSCI